MGRSHSRALGAISEPPPKSESGRARRLERPRVDAVSRSCTRRSRKKKKRRLRKVSRRARRRRRRSRAPASEERLCLSRRAQVETRSRREREREREPRPPLKGWTPACLLRARVWLASYQRTTSEVACDPTHGDARFLLSSRATQRWCGVSKVRFGRSRDFTNASLSEHSLPTTAREKKSQPAS